MVFWIVRYWMLLVCIESGKEILPLLYDIVFVMVDLSSISTTISSYFVSVSCGMLCTEWKVVWSIHITTHKYQYKEILEFFLPTMQQKGLGILLNANAVLLSAIYVMQPKHVQDFSHAQKSMSLYSLLGEEHTLLQLSPW